MLQIHKKNCYLAAPAEFVVDGLVSDYDYGSGGADGDGGGNADQNTPAGDAGGFQWLGFSALFLSRDKFDWMI